MCLVMSFFSFERLKENVSVELGSETLFWTICLKSERDVCWTVPWTDDCGWRGNLRIWPLFQSAQNTIPVTSEEVFTPWQCLGGGLLPSSRCPGVQIFVCCCLSPAGLELTSCHPDELSQSALVYKHFLLDSKQRVQEARGRFVFKKTTLKCFWHVQIKPRVGNSLCIVWYFTRQSLRSFLLTGEGSVRFMMHLIVVPLPVVLRVCLGLRVVG